MDKFFAMRTPPFECGLVIITNYNKILPIPLKKVSVRARLVDFVAQVSLEQTYKNDEKQPVEAIYMFPLDEGASVINFEAELEGSTIKGIIKEKEEAKEQYETALKNQQTAFLAQENKPDIFQVKVGNLAPGAEAKIKLTYLSEMSVEGEALRFYIPTTIAPRYVPPSDTSQEAQDIGNIPYSQFSPAPMKIDVECEMKSKILKIESPTHGIITNMKTTAENEGNFFMGQASISGQTTDMDRDFVLLVTTENPHQPRVCVEKYENSVAAFVSLIPSFNLDEQPVDLIFLLDRSGSMMGESINQAKKALTLFLRSLPMDCYFNIVGFGSSFRFLFPQSIMYGDESLKAALYHASSLNADLGGTEIYSPLNEIFKREPVKGYLRQLFILTDGQVSNTQKVINLVHQNCHNTRVFALGIGDSASHHLVEGIARAGGGTAEFVTYNEALHPKVQRQLKNALFPALTEVSVIWDGAALPQAAYFGGQLPEQEIVMEKTLLGYRKSKPHENVDLILKGPRTAPFHIPPVFDGSRLLVYCIWEDGSIPTGVTITAKSPDGPLTVSVSVSEDDILTGDFLHKLAGRKMIRDLEEESSYLHSLSGMPSPDIIKREIVKLGCKYGLVSSCTSFVAVDSNKQKLEFSWAMQTRQVSNQFANNWHGIGMSGSQSISFASFTNHTFFIVVDPQLMDCFTHANMEFVTAPTSPSSNKLFGRTGSKRTSSVPFGSAAHSLQFSSSAATTTSFGTAAFAFGASGSGGNSSSLFGTGGNSPQQPIPVQVTPSFGTAIRVQRQTRTSGALFGSNANSAQFAPAAATTSIGTACLFGAEGSGGNSSTIFGTGENSLQQSVTAHATPSFDTAFGAQRHAGTSGALFGTGANSSQFAPAQTFGSVPFGGQGNDGTCKPFAGFGGNFPQSAPLPAAFSFGFGAQGETAKSTRGGLFGNDDKLLFPTPLPQPTDKLEALLQFFNFDGSFRPEHQLAEMLGVSWQEVEKASTTLEFKLTLWMTALAVKFLEIALATQKETWELAATKSKKWLSKAVTNSASVLQHAEEFLREKGVTEENSDK